MIGTFVSLVGVLFIAHPASLFNALRNAADEPPAGSPGDASPSQPDAGDYDSVTPMQRLAGVGVALVGVCGATGAFTTIRWIGKRAHPLISVNYFAVWCTFISIVMQLALPSIGFLLPSGMKEWGLLFFLGVCGFVMVSDLCWRKLAMMRLTAHCSNSCLPLLCPTRSLRELQT